MRARQVAPPSGLQRPGRGACVAARKVATRQSHRMLTSRVRRFDGASFNTRLVAYHPPSPKILCTSFTHPLSSIPVVTSFFPNPNSQTPQLSNQLPPPSFLPLPSHFQQMATNYFPPILPASHHSPPHHPPSPLIQSQPSPDTTVMINLRSFEEESKLQAEKEYDETYSPLQNLPDSVTDPRQRAALKKRRKVRSAIVSRRKSAIYEKKLEAELELRTNVNHQLKHRVKNFSIDLADIQRKINILQNSVSNTTSTTTATTATPTTAAVCLAMPCTTLPISTPHPLAPPLSVAPPLHPLPSFTSIQSSQPLPLPSPKCLGLPRLHEPRDSSQVTFSTNHSP